MSRFLAAAASSALLALTSCASLVDRPAPEAQAAFDALIAELTADYFTAAPESATYWGVSEDVAGGRFEDRLSARGVDARAEAGALLASMIARLEAFNPRGLDDDRRLTRDVLIERLGAGLAVAEAAGGYGDVAADSYTIIYPITQISGIHSDLPTMIQSQHPLTTAQDARDYVTRLNAFAVSFDGVIETLENDAAMGAVPPDFVVAGAIDLVEGFLEPAPRENALYTSFVERLGDADPAIAGADQLAEAAAESVEDVVYPAYERLGDALRELLPQATHDPSIESRPNGAAVYQALIRLLGDSDLTPAEIHQIGLDEVARIHGEMDAILASIGMTEGTVGERMRALGEEPRFLYPNTDAGRAELLADLNGRLDEVMARAPDWFATVPTQPMEVRRIQPFREDSSPGGFAQFPSVDGSRPGVFWINLRDLNALPRYTLPTLTYHEGAPGHLLQGGIAVAQTETPLLRTIFAGTNAYVEGWGLYAERLAWEMGLYEGDPYGDLGRLQYELHRAVRLVVDTGMHAMGWSREDAIDYMAAAEGSDPSEVVVEIERYAAWPAQALGYKLGMLKILELRGRAEAALGEDFDIREFHDLLLADGGLPLPVLEAKVDAWIAEQGR